MHRPIPKVDRDWLSWTIEKRVLTTNYNARK